MTEPSEQQKAMERVDALFDGQPTGQSFRTVARGLSRIGNKPFTIVVEGELPLNSEANPDGMRQQMEVGFHAMFGREAQHIDGDGNVSNDLSESIEVEITGDFDDEAAQATRDLMQEIVKEHSERAKQQGMKRLMSDIIRPDGPSLN